VKIRDHHIIRSTIPLVAKRPAAFRATSVAAQEVFTPSQPSEPGLPDLSGLAKFSQTKSIGVKDSKLEDDSKRVLLLDNSTGGIQELDIDWSKTGRPRDLEAITPGQQPGDFFAVEGSSWKDSKARLFDLKVNEHGGEARNSYVLPDFGQEVEGLVCLPGENGSQTFLFGGRGDENGNSRVFWGSLNQDGLRFSPEGLIGKKVDAPHLGEGQRSISDLALDEKGRLWATAAIDEGNNGPFDSMVYEVGHITSQGNEPFRNSSGPGVLIKGTKGEALVAQGNGSFLMGSDNESHGGRFEQFLIADHYA
jgi:hypothetical protein